MTLPSSETIPDDFNDLPPAQKRRIRHSLRDASESELQSLLLELQRRSTPAFEYFLLSLCGALLVGLALIIDSPFLLAASALCVPILTPLMGVSISPALRKIPFLLQSLASILISLIFHFGFGSLAGVIAGALNRPLWKNMPMLDITQLVSWVVLVFAAVLASILFVRYEVNPRLPGVLISYLVFIPVASAGYLLTYSGDGQWLPLLLTSLTFLMTAIFISSLTCLFLGLIPKKTIGWLILLVAPIAIALLLIFGGTRMTMPPLPLASDKVETIETPCPIATCDLNAEVPVCELPVFPTETKATISTSTPTSESVKTPTPAPTPIWAKVVSENGAIIRKGPGFENAIAAYASDGSLIQLLPETYLNGNVLWVKVIAQDLTEGWILGSLLVTPQP